MMNIVKNLNKLRTGKAKTLFLAGLIGLLPSCKKDTWEDFKTRNQNPGQSGDTPAFTVEEPFMGNLSNVRNAVFYEPTEDTHCFLFNTNIMNEVNGVTELRDMKDKAPNICNPYELARVDNTSIDGNRAKFMSPPYYVYEVEYENQYGNGHWSIDCVPENSEYLNMTNQELANLAYSRIISKYPDQTYHAQQIRDAILNGQGQWTQDESFYVTFNSNGWTQNLRHSDFGTFDFATLDNSEGFTSMFSGGVPEKEVQKSMVQPQTFRATAYGNVKYEDDDSNSEQRMYISTGRDSATFTIDAMQNETIVMPFQNWYTVTIVRTNNSVTSRFENTGSIPTMWQIPHQNVQETGYREGFQDNDLYVKDGLYGDENSGDRFVTGTAVNYYTDETGYVEFVGQGYRQDWLQNAHVKFTFSFGGTNRPRTDDPTTGIEEIHYSAPKRSNITPYQKQK